MWGRSLSSHSLALVLTGTTTGQNTKQHNAIKTLGVFSLAPWRSLANPINPNPNTTLVNYHLLKVIQLRVLPYVKQEAQLMLTNPRDAFRGQSRSSNIGIVSSCAIVTLHMLNVLVPTGFVLVGQKIVTLSLRL